MTGSDSADDSADNLKLVPSPSVFAYCKRSKTGYGKGLAKNYARKCLDGRNAAGCVDEGKNVSPANQRSSSTNDRKQIYGRT